MHIRSSGPYPSSARIRSSVSELGGIEPRHVSGEIEMRVRPLTDRREASTERIGHDVSRVAHEDGPVAHPGIASNLLDHLGVVVGGESAFWSAAVRHGQEANEIGEPDVGSTFLLRVLVQIVVELPGLVADPQVVRLVADDVVEHHEVGEENLVHASQGLEALQVVLGRLALDVMQLVGKLRARRMDALPPGL